jgi:hypothetical protein
MTWSVEQQKKYSERVPASHLYAPGRVDKLLKDTNLSGTISSGVHFLMEDAVAEAYRAGAMDSIFGTDTPPEVQDTPNGINTATNIDELNTRRLLAAVREALAQCEMDRDIAREKAFRSNKDLAVQKELTSKSHHPFCNFWPGPLGGPGCICAVVTKRDKAEAEKAELELKALKQGRHVLTAKDGEQALCGGPGKCERCDKTDFPELEITDADRTANLPSWGNVRADYIANGPTIACRERQLRVALEKNPQVRAVDSKVTYRIDFQGQTGEFWFPAPRAYVPADPTSLEEMERDYQQFLPPNVVRLVEVTTSERILKQTGVPA